MVDKFEVGKKYHSRYERDVYYKILMVYGQRAFGLPFNLKGEELTRGPSVINCKEDNYWEEYKEPRKLKYWVVFYEPRGNPSLMSTKYDLGSGYYRNKEELRTWFNNSFGDRYKLLDIKEHEWVEKA